MILSFIILVSLLGACDFPQRRQEDISVTLNVDGASRVVSVPAGTTAREALETGGIVINPDDRSDQ